MKNCREKKDFVSNNKNEWRAMVKLDLAEHNNDAHPEDRLTYADWLDELCGSTIYGYSVVRTDYSDGRYQIIKNQIE